MQKNINKIVLAIVFVILYSGFEPAKAQQDSQYTQYMYNTISINPAYAGTRGTTSVFALYRNQWVGLDGAPETLNFSINAPSGIKNVGLGLSFVSDKIGPSSENLITADISYNIQLSRTLNLAFGVKAGVSLFDLDPNKLTIFNPNDFDLTRNSSTSPVIGTGAYLYNDKWYVGVSTPNLLETDHYDEIQLSAATEKLHMYLIGGYTFDINDDLKLKPAFLAKAVNGAPLALDLSANALINNGLILGVGYRLDASISGLAGFQINRNIMIGYSYDYSNTELRTFNDGSHEIFLRFEFGGGNNNGNGKFNPRFF